MAHHIDLDSPSDQPENNSADNNGNGGCKGNNEELTRRVRALVETVAPDSVLGYSFEDHFKIVSDVIRGMLVKRRLPPQEIDDGIQEVWLAVLKHLPTLEYNDNRSGLRAWFIQLVRSKLMNVYRRKKRKPAGSLERAQAHGYEPTDHSPDVAAELDREWMRQTVHVVLEKLNGHVPESYRRVLAMRFLEGRSVAEVADELHLKSGDVWTLQHRALQKFRAAFNLFLGRHFDDDIVEIAAIM